MSLAASGLNALGGFRREIVATNRTGSTLTVGGVYALDVHGSATESTDAESNCGNVVAVSTTNLAGILVVALQATTDDTVGRFVLQGVCNCLVDGDTNDVDEGTRLIPENARNALTSIADSAVGYCCAIALEANNSTAALKKVFFDGLNFHGQAAIS